MIKRPHRTSDVIRYLIVLLALVSPVHAGLSTAQAIPAHLAKAAEAIHAVSFSDREEGEIAWTVKKDELPWKGSYSFMGFADSAAQPLTLLSVYDADSGLRLAACATPVSPKAHPTAAWRDELEHAFHWNRVSWELDDAGLECNTTADLRQIRAPTDSEEVDAYVVKIEAAQGPRCLRNLHVEDEEAGARCPPQLARNRFRSQNLTCGCPLLKRAGLTPHAAFSSIRRKPTAHAPPADDDPLALPQGDAPAESEESVAPAFPRFTFTSSMEQETEHGAADNKTVSTDTPPSAASAETPATQAGEPKNASQETTPVEAEPAATAEAAPASAETEAPPTEAAPHESAEHQQEETPQSQPSPPSGETGAAAESACDEFACQHNGTCALDEEAQPRCECADGFGGEHCEQDLCKAAGCKNGGRCQVRNGRALCHCPNGVQGEQCQTVELPICAPACENGGLCQANPNPADEARSICQCAHGFTGANCNLRDLCARNETCAHFGADARCFRDAADMYRVSERLQDGAHSCQCPTVKGFVECQQLRPALAHSAPTFHSQPPPPPPRPSGSAGPLGPPATPEPASVELMPTNGPVQFPRLTTQEQQQQQQGVSGQSPQASSPELSAELRPNSPLFGLTALPGSSPTVLPRPTRPPAPAAAPVGSTFTRLPDLNHLLSSSSAPPTRPSSEQDTSAASTPPHTTTESEEEGDDGFAVQTQDLNIPNPSRPGLPIHKLSAPSSAAPPLPTTTIPEAAEESAPASHETQGHIVHGEHGPMGPEHSIVDETIGTESPPEFHTIDPSGRPKDPFGSEEADRSLRPTTASAERPAEAEEDEEFTQKPDSGSDEARPSATTPASTAVQANDLGVFGAESGRKEHNYTWIIALTIVGVLLLAAVFGAIFMTRYVKRSRRLHGKYNPAREENAVASTYAMPMTSVTKDERLI